MLLVGISDRLRVPLARKLGLAVDRPAWESIAEAVPLEGVDVDLVEVHVTSDLPIVGRRLRDGPPGPAMLVTAVVRGRRAILPRADTIFEAGDLAVMAVDRRLAEVKDVTAWARGETISQPEDDTLPPRGHSGLSRTVSR